ncbi:hypothetical protein FW781_14575 [Chryseobacterium panacisoli]|uniref:Lipoprotein n=1 Tax=Chryseobacterium panacisoli TaxID=1807141 RepID=A0A5D8ZJL5_9FLAO|nr:hypothetical protein [Chryseobacterium panacisoli]TZF95118.1 hypothetical protein FW781_14575 [Chryseobacterium panacisoli]
MRIILALITMSIILSCNVKKQYERGDLVKSKSLDILTEKFDLNENNTAILFMETFSKDSLIIKNSKSEIIKKVLLDSRPQLELTSIQLFPNNEDIILDFKNSRKIFIKKKELSKYKLIYISKPAYESNKYVIVFTNNWKRLR